MSPYGINKNLLGSNWPSLFHAMTLTTPQLQLSRYVVKGDTHFFLMDIESYKLFVVAKYFYGYLNSSEEIHFGKFIYTNRRYKKLFDVLT